MRPFHSEPRWLALVRQLAALVTIAAVAVTVAVLSLTWALEREHGALVIAPDSSSGPLFPVCSAGPMYYYPARQLRRLP